MFIYELYFFWYGLQEVPVKTTFDEIVHEWNADPQHVQISLKHFQNYGEAVDNAFAEPSTSQPSFVLAPEYMTSRMIAAATEKKIIPITELVDAKRFENIPEIIKKLLAIKMEIFFHFLSILPVGFFIQIKTS